MDFYRLFATCIFGAVSLLGVEAMDACVQDMATEYSECMQSLMPLIQALGSSASVSPDPTDPMAGTTAMMEVLCSPEGRGGMNCMLGVMKRCPALMGGAQGATGLMPGLDLNALMGGGGMEAACEMLTGPCKAILPCVEKAMREEQSDMMGTEAGVTDGGRESGYSVLYQICGPKREVVMCISDHLKECPHTSAKFREHAKEQAKNSPISYDKVEHFILHDCKDMPTALKNDQSCETAALASDGYRGCFDGMVLKYNISGSTTRLSCDAYDDAAECLDTHVEPTCGKESTDFLKKGTAMFIPGMPTENACYGTTGSAVILQSSATLVMIASMFVLGRL